MSNSATTKNAWAKAIYEAQRNGTRIGPPTETFGELSTNDGYAVQALVSALHTRNGNPQIGWKVGATSASILAWAGSPLSEPLYGACTAAMIRGADGQLRRSDYELGIEAEIGVIMQRPLRGPGVTPLDARRAAYGVSLLMEVVTTRYNQRPKNRADVVADDSGHGGIIFGPQVAAARDFDFIHEGVVIKKNGRLWMSACGCEALGDPLKVVAWLANKLAEQGRQIEPGQFVSTGSITQIMTPEIGDVVSVSTANLGAIQLAITE